MEPTTWLPKRVAIQGHSAGANVCLNLLGGYDSGDPHANDPVERMSSRPDLMAMMCLWPHGKAPEAYPIRPDPPPVFIASAEHDSVALTAFSKRIATSIETQGGTVSWFIVGSGGHGAFHYGTPEEGGEWPEVLVPLLVK